MDLVTDWSQDMQDAICLQMTLLRELDKELEDYEE